MGFVAYRALVMLVIRVQGRVSTVHQSGSMIDSIMPNRRPSGHSVSCSMTCCVVTFLSTVTIRSSTLTSSIGAEHPSVRYRLLVS